MTAREDQEGTRYWSKKEKLEVVKTIAEWTQQSRNKDKDTVWTGDELRDLAGSIAGGIENALNKLGSFSEGDRDVIYTSVLVAVRQIFIDDSFRSVPSLAVEDEIIRLYSQDYDNEFAKELRRRSANAGEDEKPKTKAEDNRKWEALAPLIHMKLPFRNERQIKLRASEMNLKSESLTRQ